MLTRSEIRYQCTNSTTYTRGNDLYIRGHVGQLEWHEKENNRTEVTARVQGSGRLVYRVNITVSDGDYIKDYDCECPAMATYWGMCKHCAAAAMAFQAHQQEEDKLKRAKSVLFDVSSSNRGLDEPQTSLRLSSLMASLNAPSANADLKLGRESIRLLPAFTFSARTNPPFHAGVFMELSIDGGKRPYIVKNQAQLLFNVQRGRFHKYGQSLAFVHSPEMFDLPSRRLLEYSRAALDCLTTDLTCAASAAGNEYRNICLTDEDARVFLNDHVGDVLTMEGKTYTLKEGNPDPAIVIEPARKMGADIRLPCFYLFYPGVRPWILYGDSIFHTTEEFGRVMLPALITLGSVYSRPGACQIQPTYTLFLNSKDYRSFCVSVLPLLEKFFAIQYDQMDLSEYKPIEPEFSFRLSMDENSGVRLDALVHYGSASYPLFAVGNEYRNAEKEQPIRELAREYFTQEEAPGVLCAPDDDAVYNLLETGMDRLRAVGEVLVEDSMTNMRISPTPKTTIGVALHGDLIDLDVQVEGISPEEIGQLLGAYRLKKRYYRLRSGEFLSLEGGGLTVVHELAAGLRTGNRSLEHLQIPAFRAQYINSVVSGSENVELKRSTDFKKVIRSLRSFADSDYSLPENLHADLRQYQQEGYMWMCSLADCQLDGILADEMGLGKTLQAIAFLLHTGQNALVVCPATLMYNWVSELNRFAPDLKVQAVTGSAELRRQLLNENADVFVTSYDLLKRDIREYTGHTYGTVLIDEAQYIRNAGTQSAKAVKQLNADHRFALTGTPIENRLSDLWSIFDFLMPDFLYEYSVFRSELEQPIIDGEEAARERLKKMISPFILRRKKSDVLKELPEKVESVQYIDMTEPQRAQYLAREQQLREMLQNTDEGTFNASRIEYLSELTRLRQICCDPALFLEGYHGGSGKVDACMDLLIELTETGHKVLVFSQFTSMLDVLHAEADSRKISSLMLTGSNTKEQRRDMVLQFQNGDTMLFFISLKAGGTGLNLTAADRVIHVDPWWNAAAEDQASDRTHRIGQKNTVFITKLVAKDTVEERIIALQQAKRELSEGVLTGEGSGMGRITREELLALLQGEVNNRVKQGL